VGSETLQANPAQKEEPKFSCKDASQQQVINIFFLFVTEGATGRM
jgi:hypothetical protein